MTRNKYIFPEEDIMIRIRKERETDDLPGSKVEVYRLGEKRGIAIGVCYLGHFSLNDVMKEGESVSLDNLIERMRDFLTDGISASDFP